MKIRIILFKIILYGVLTVIAIIVFTLLSFWIELKIDVTLPAPTGSFDVGRTTFYWADSSRTDSLSSNPKTKRELVVWIWYPASKTNSDTIADYQLVEWEKAIDDQSDFIFRNFFTRRSAKIHTHSFQNANLSDNQTAYPVILMKSGIGAMATDYTTLAEDLASHGYIVVGSDAPYSTFLVVLPDGRIIKRTAEGNPGEAEIPSGYRNQALNRLLNIWIDDTKFILSKLEWLNTIDSSCRFFGRLDLQSVGIFGHSFGGAVAAQFCLEDSRCKSGADLDGAPYGSVIQEGFNKPFMFLLADHSEEFDTISLHIKSNIKSIYDSLPGSRVWINLEGARHFNFSDMELQKEVLISRLFGATGSIGGKRGLEVINACLRAFFDEHLKSKSPSVIQDLPDKYPEVKFEK